VVSDLVGAHRVAALVVFVRPDHEGDETPETQQAADGEERNNGERHEDRAEEEQHRRRQEDGDRGPGEREPCKREHGAHRHEDGHQPQHLTPVEWRILLRPEVQRIGPLLELWHRVRHLAPLTHSLAQS
jgi:hypothetical protein